MRSFTDSLVRYRTALVGITLAIVLGGTIVVSSEDGGGSVWPAVIFGGLVALTVASMVLSLSGHDSDSTKLAVGLAPTSASSGLVDRWLKRTRYYRFVGGAVGLVVGVGFIDNGRLAPVAIGMFAGVAGGGALAEIHLLRRKQQAARSAGLTARRLADYVRRTDVIRFALVAVVAVALLGASPIVDEFRRASLVRWALAALLVALVAVTLQRLVVLRTRPALRPDLRDADDLLRRLAATQGFVRPSLALCVALLAQSVSALGMSDGGDFIILAMWLIAIWILRSSRLDADHLLPTEAAST
ncbi:MAG: hypothetical protein GY926_10100 [bacterium]|nr:hypothetical protein [bacterium]